PRPPSPLPRFPYRTLFRSRNLSVPYSSGCHSKNGLLSRYLFNAKAQRRKVIVDGDDPFLSAPLRPRVTRLFNHVAIAPIGVMGRDRKSTRLNSSHVKIGCA